MLPMAESAFALEAMFLAVAIPVNLLLVTSTAVLCKVSCSANLPLYVPPALLSLYNKLG